MPALICGDQLRSGFHALLIGDRLFQHGLVKFKPNLLDVAGLFFTDQIAGAAQIKVVTRKVKPSTEAVERLHNFQAFLRCFC